MSIDALGLLYSGPDRTGTSTLIGIGQGNRYTPIRGSRLQDVGLYQNIQSGYLTSPVTRDVNLTVFFGDGHFNGDFVQMTWPKGGGEGSFWSTSNVRSVLLTASAPGGHNQFMRSYRDMFLSDWKTHIDTEMGGSASRRGDPVLSWEMFPTNPAYKWLNTDLAYLKVHQDVRLHTPWYMPDYDAWLEYWIYLHISNGNVRAWVPQYWWWVEGGWYTSCVSDQFKPKVAAGAGALQTHLNEELAKLDGLTNGAAKDVFYLPGAQSVAPGSDVHGNTGQDVTIVLDF